MLNEKIIPIWNDKFKYYVLIINNIYIKKITQSDYQLYYEI